MSDNGAREANLDNQHRAVLAAVNALRPQPITQAEADNLQRRRYAEAALSGLIAEGERSNTDCVVLSFDIADQMLTEQRRREGGE